MEDVVEHSDFSFPKAEEAILRQWNETKAFEQQLERTKELPEYVFYDGPPFATGLPHYGHILAGTIKDIVTRYQTATGHHVTRRFGWDCHGLPVEYEIDKKLKIKTKKDVLDMGIGVYNDECRGIVTRYVGEWEKVVRRSGRWVDFENGYKTMDFEFMESVWWVFGELFNKGLVYQGSKVMYYSTGCKTLLSNFEATLNTKQSISDPDVMVSFPILDDKDAAAFVAWTTTPWTLPSNLALCVNSDLEYVKVKSNSTGKVYVVAECRLSELPAADNPKKGTPVDDKTAGSYQVLDKFPGSSLVGKKYQPLFDYFEDFKDTAFRVVADNYVASDAGAGIVHVAPAFGPDDYRVWAVDEEWLIYRQITEFSGRYIKEAERILSRAVKEEKAGLSSQRNFDTRISRYCLEIGYRLNLQSIAPLEKYGYTIAVKWQDWAVSRSRFWGTPLPIWTSDDGVDIVVIGSVEELERRSGEK
ncbi:isoleucine--tRNA ligase, cytoplasmic, partial [Tanacetum coccineum]